MPESTEDKKTHEQSFCVIPFFPFQLVINDDPLIS